MNIFRHNQKYFILQEKWLTLIEGIPASILDKFSWILNSVNNLASKTRASSYLFNFSFLILLGIPSINFIINIIFKVKNDQLLNSLLAIISDIFGLIGLSFAFLSYIVQKGKFKISSDKFSEAMKFEIQKISVFLDSVSIDSADTKLITFLINKLQPLYINLYDNYEDFYSFGVKFYSDLSNFLAMYYKLSVEKKIFLELNIFSFHYQLRHKYIDTIKNADFFKENSPYAKALLLYHEYSNQRLNEFLSYDTSSLSFDIPTLENIFQDVITPDSSSVVQLMKDLKEEKLSNMILENVISQSYSIVGIENRKKELIHGPCLLVKNEESFESWWNQVEQKGKRAFKLKNPEATESEIEAYSIKSFIQKSNKDLIKQPFSTALKNDPYLKPVLDYNKWSPLYLLNANNLPINYRGKPIEYINIEIKKKAKIWQDRLIKAILKKEPEIGDIEKELAFDFEIIPFDIGKIRVITRTDKTPRAIENLYLEQYISKENRGSFVEAHILQIKSILKNVSPFSLVINSVSLEIKHKLVNLELEFLSQIEKKKLKTTKFEGLENILKIEPEKKVIVNILFKISQKQKLKVSKATCEKILTEIFMNAKFIKKNL